MTRAEQLAEAITPSVENVPEICDLLDAASELRRLSAVEARCVELEKVLNTDTKLQGKLTATVIHQAALIQQAKEAIEAAMKKASKWHPCDPVLLELIAAKAAINEWEKSNG